MKAEDIGSFDITPSWERPAPPPAQEPPNPLRTWFCQCGLCQLAAEGHL